MLDMRIVVIQISGLGSLQIFDFGKNPFKNAEYLSFRSKSDMGRDVPFRGLYLALLLPSLDLDLGLDLDALGASTDSS